MPNPVQTTDEFLRLVRRSGLVEATDEPRLAATVAAWPDGGAAPSPEMLQALIDAELLTGWQIEQLVRGKHKGFVLGKYKLLRLLGAGGMSSVYLAEHTALRSKAAIKVLPLRNVDRASYLARFEREARQSARLGHPNIVRTFDLGVAGSIHYIAMEYVDGVDLHAKVKREGPLSVRDAADVVRQAALGLHHAHEEGIVHRDVKPANLMLDGRGTVKILDLGLALAGGDEDGSLTREHDEKVLGTADYLAPEQASDSHRADRRADVYALGCTLHYLLVGRPPFAGGSIAERIQGHLRRPPPSLLDERPDVPAALADLYFRMLEKNPDARPQTAQAVADALAVWLAIPAPAAAGSRADPPRRHLPRRGPEPGGPVAVHQNGPGGDAGSSVSLVVPRRVSDPRSAPAPAGPPARDAAPRAPGAASGRAAATAPPSAVPVAPPGRRRRRPGPEFAGMPLGFWIAMAVGVAVVTILAVVLARRERAAPAHASSISQEPAASSSRLVRCVRS